MAFLFTKIIRNVIIVIVLFNAINYYLQWKSYTIIAKDFKNTATNSADKDSLTALSKFTAEMKRLYKNKISSEPIWVPISIGNLQFRAQLLYATPFEYIAAFVSPLQSVGRAGLHWSNSSCTVLSGFVHRYSDAFSGPVKESFANGQNLRHGQFESFIYKLEEDTTIVCYGRGMIPFSGITASISGISDPLALTKLYYAYGKLVFENLAIYFTETYKMLHKKTLEKFEL